MNVLISIACLKSLPFGRFVRMDSTIPPEETESVDCIVWAFMDKHQYHRKARFDIRNGFYLGDVID